MVASATAPEQLAPEDRAVPGRYLARVDLKLSDADAASAALDGFHSEVPVAVLDDFEFSVFDGERELEPNPAREGYALRSACLSVEKIDGEITPRARPVRRGA